MKLVINTAFGGFCLPDGFCELHGLERETVLTVTSLSL